MAYSIGDTKSIMQKSVPAVKTGGMSSGGGPTVSSRSYPKGSKPGDSQNAPFNPQKVPVTTIYVGGVGS